MATIPNKDQVPSNAPRNLKFNAEKMDEAINSKETEYTDRLGVKRKTWAGIESDLDAIITSLDTASFTFPDLTTGVLATTDGQYFRVINANGDQNAFTYYRKTGDAAVEITSIASSGKVEHLSDEVDILINKTEPLENIGDSIFDVVTSNGLRVLRIREDLKTELTEVVTLKTGDSGLSFSGNAIDNKAPPGWAFVIHSANGLIIAGVKDDGTSVGFGDSDNSSGQSGEIIPGDTAATYDAIRQYNGSATVKDVVGNRIAGRFIVDANDTSSPDDGGGCLVDVLGRRWKRQADYVTYDMFGAPRIPVSVYETFSKLLGQGDFTAAAAMISSYSYADEHIINCHAYANKLRIPVVQNDGVFLWKNGEIDVQTNGYLSGATLVSTDESGVDELRWGPYRGVDESAPEPIRQYVINGKPRVVLTAPQLNQLNTTYSSYLKRGSTMLPMPDLAQYRGGMLFLLSSEVDYIRYGQPENARNTVLKRDYSLIGKAGALSDRLEKTFRPGSIIYAAITQKEDSFLNFYPPKFHETGKNRRFINITQYRAMVNIFDQVHHDNGNGVSASRVVYRAIETFECNLIRGQVEASHLNDGAYGLGFLDCLSASVHRYYGEYGWGLNGHHGIKKLVTSDNKWNRFDVHTFGADITSTNDEIKGLGVNMQGSGKWTFNNIKHVVPSTDNSSRFEAMQNGLFFPREDYSSDCDIELEINSLMVQFDSTNPNWYSAATHSYDVVRLLGNDSVDNGSDTRTPVVIRGKNITFDLEGVQKLGVNTEDFVFSFVRSVRSEKTDYDATGRRTYLPDVIDVDGMTAINVPPGKNAWMNIIKMPETLYQNYNGSRNLLRPDGTNARISGRNIHSVVNSPVVTRGYNNMVSLPGDSANWNASYLNGPNAWVPDIQLDNCSPVLADMRGTRGRLTVTGGILSRFEAPVTGVAAKAVGVTAQLYPDASGQTYLSSSSIAFFGSHWMNPAGGAVYNGILRGSANEHLGDTSKAPNIPSSVFI